MLAVFFGIVVVAAPVVAAVLEHSGNVGISERRHSHLSVQSQLFSAGFVTLMYLRQTQTLLWHFLLPSRLSCLWRGTS